MTRGEAKFWFNLAWDMCANEEDRDDMFRDTYESFRHAVGSKDSLDEHTQERISELEEDVADLQQAPKANYDKLRGRIAELERMVVGEYAKKIAEERLAEDDSTPQEPSSLQLRHSAKVKGFPRTPVFGPRRRDND